MDSEMLEIGSPQSSIADRLLHALIEHWEKGSKLNEIDGLLAREPEVQAYLALDGGYEKLCQLGSILEKAYALRGVGWALEDKNGKVALSDCAAERARLSKNLPASVVSSHLSSIDRRLKALRARSPSRVFVYGGGTHTLQIWPLLEKHFSKVDGVLDRNPERAAFQGEELLDVEAFRPISGDVVVLSSMTYETEMRLYLVKRFGTGLEIVSLYETSAWVAFQEGLKREEHDANRLFDTFLEWLEKSPNKRRINASGFLLELQRRLGPPNHAGSPVGGPFVSAQVTKFFEQTLLSLWKKRASKLLRKLEGARSLCWFDCYALGDYIAQPTLSLCAAMLEKSVDCILLIVTDNETMRHLDPELDERIVILELQTPPVLTVLADALGRAEFELIKAEFESAPDVLRGYFSRMEIDLRKQFGLSCLYSEMLRWLSARYAPSLYVNLQDNRLLSRSFHYAFGEKGVKVLQLQHGILSSGLGPFWADCYVGWKDEHSAHVFRSFSGERGEFLPFGNYNANRLSERAAAMTFQTRSKERPLFVFFFQGPAFWHVTYYMINHALKMILEAFPQIQDDWDIAVKMRKPFGESLLMDLFAMHGIAGRIELISAGEDNLEVFNRADLIGVISTSVSQEALLFGKASVSIESDDWEGLVRLSEWDLGEKVRDSSQLVEVLGRLKREGLDREGLQEVNSYLKVLPEDEEALTKRLSCLIGTCDEED